WIQRFSLRHYRLYASVGIDNHSELIGRENCCSASAGGACASLDGVKHCAWHHPSSLHLIQRMPCEISASDDTWHVSPRNNTHGIAPSAYWCGSINDMPAKITDLFPLG